MTGDAGREEAWLSSTIGRGKLSNASIRTVPRRTDQSSETKEGDVLIS